MAQLYELDLTQVSEAEMQQWIAEMDDASRTRVLSLGKKRMRESVAGDHLARTALVKMSGKAAQEILILRTETGKPYADEGCFSISHSGETVVCAVSETPVGVDVERIRKPPARVAQRYFTEAERAQLETDETEFWRIWTGKEALCKLTGEGLAGLKHCDTLTLPEGVVLTTTIRDDYVIAVAELD